MNQILATKPVKQRKGTVEIKTVIIFFAISLIIFGICMVTSGSYAIYNNMSMGKAPKNNNYNNTNTNNNYASQSSIQIKLAVDGGNIIATVDGENEISFVTYRWDEEDEIREEINSYSKDISIEIPSGQHTLTVTAVDNKNNEETKKQQVKGISKPKINVVRDNEAKTLLVELSDGLGLKNAKIIFNGQEGEIDLNGEIEKSIRCPLKEGKNTLEVNVTNTEGATETLNETYNN